LYLDLYIQMHIKRLIFLISVLFSLIGFAQEKQYDYTAFGLLPKVVSNDLHVNLNSAKITEIRVQYLDTIARIYLKAGQPDSLIHYGKLLKNESANIDSDIINRNNYNQKALYYEGAAAQQMGLFDEAIKYYINGIESKQTDNTIQGYLKLQLAQTYLQKNEITKAKNLLKELPQAKKPKDFYLKGIVVKSHYLILENNYNLAKRNINEALLESFIEDYQKLKLELELNLSKIILRQRNFLQLIPMSQQIKSKALKEGFYDIYIEASINEGYAEAMQGNFEIAELALSSAYVNTIQWNRLELQQRVINALVQLYSVNGDYKNAYSLMTQYQGVTREIAQKQNQRLVKDLELKYETLKKEKEIDKLQEDQLVQEAEISRQKTIKYAFLIGFLIILVPIILLLVVYYQKLQTQSLLNKQQEAINQQEVKGLLQSQELELAKNTIAVQSMERNRIARELHDSIGGNLAGIKLNMNSLGDNQPEFRQILNQLDATYDQVREISHSLIPKEFEASAFTDLVNNHIQNISKDTTVNLRFATYGNDSINDLNVQLQVALFNIIKELVTNALKHANAEEINIQLTSDLEEHTVELIYEDDGVGFDHANVNKGIGLNNIKTRVVDFNGILSINTAVNRGTVISISLPQT